MREPLREDTVAEFFPLFLAGVGRVLLDADQIAQREAETRAAGLDDAAFRAQIESLKADAQSRYSAAKREVGDAMLLGLRMAAGINDQSLRLLLAELMRTEREATAKVIESMQREIDDLARAVARLEFRQDADHETQHTERWR